MKTTARWWESDPALETPNKAPSKTDLPVGLEVNGYRFKGGNPKDQRNWQPVS